MAAQTPLTKALIGHFSEAMTLQRKLLRECPKFVRMTKELSVILTNMNLVASRIEGGGGPLGLMAKNYALVLGETRQFLEVFLNGEGGLRDLHAVLSGCVRRFGGAAMQYWVLEDAKSHPNVALPFAMEAMVERLERDLSRQRARTDASFQDLTRACHRFEQQVSMLKRGAVGLFATRILCKAEGAHRVGDVSLTAIVNELEQYQPKTAACVDGIYALGKQFIEVIDEARACHLEANRQLALS